MTVAPRREMNEVNREAWASHEEATFEGSPDPAEGE